ncbi:MAG: type IV pilus modification PilV family protein [Phycisphaerae bacterium]
MTINRHNPHRGFTLVEAMAGVTVLAIATTAIIMPFTTGAAHEREQARRSVAVCLATELMEQILSLPFESETGESIIDYNGHSEPIDPMLADDGTVLDDPAAAGMTRTATCEYVYVAGQDTSEPPNFIRVTVSVNYRGDTVVRLSRLIYEQ